MGGKDVHMPVADPQGLGGFVGIIHGIGVTRVLIAGMAHRDTEGGARDGPDLGPTRPRPESPRLLGQQWRIMEFLPQHRRDPQGYRKEIQSAAAVACIFCQERIFWKVRTQTIRSCRLLGGRTDARRQPMTRISAAPAPPFCALPAPTLAEARGSACASAPEISAIQVSAVQQELTDAALACGQHEVDLFNRFQTVFNKELRRSDARC